MREQQLLLSGQRPTVKSSMVESSARKLSHHMDAIGPLNSVLRTWLELESLCAGLKGMLERRQQSQTHPSQSGVVLGNDDARRTPSHPPMPPMLPMHTTPANQGRRQYK